MYVKYYLYLCSVNKMFLSSKGLGRFPFKAVIRVRIPLGIRQVVGIAINLQINKKQL